MSNAPSQSTAPIAVSTFYHFAPIGEPGTFKTPLLSRMKSLGIRGTITLATEGINGTIAGPQPSIDELLGDLRALPGFASLTPRDCSSDDVPFGRSKVKVKKELISLGVPANPSVCVGEHVAPSDWNTIITAPDVVTIDTRNTYEYELGHFKGALNPATRNFKEMVAFTEANLDTVKHKCVAMYCTGGIRCEKYSSYLVEQGFKHVYHLKGGILAYLDAIPASESLWQGECFVFDERVAVGHEA